jgi:hypothetical protein
LAGSLLENPDSKAIQSDNIRVWKYLSYLKVVGSNPVPATNFPQKSAILAVFVFLEQAGVAVGLQVYQYIIYAKILVG